jgi:hypothetical protein
MLTVTDTTLQYAIENEDVLGGDLVGVANVLYFSEGDHELFMPEIEGLLVGTVIGLKQVLGTGVISQETSELGLEGDKRQYSSQVVLQGHTRLAYLSNAYGRYVWYLLPEILTPPQPDLTLLPTELLHPNTVPEHFIVGDIAARDALPTGDILGVVSSGDTVSVDDADGEGNEITYKYLVGVGYVVFKRGETDYASAQTVNNDSAAAVPQYHYVGSTGSDARLFSDATDRPLGIHVGLSAAENEELHIVSDGLVPAIIDGTITIGAPLLADATTGKLKIRPSGNTQHVVAFIQKNLGSGKALVLLVPPFMPNTGTIEIGVSAPLDVDNQANVLEAKRTAGKFIWEGKVNLYITSARVKLRTVGSSVVYFDIYPGAGTIMFVDYITGAGSPDVYGIPTATLAGVDSNKLMIGQELRISYEEVAVGAEDPTFLIAYEEEVKL